MLGNGVGRIAAAVLHLLIFAHIAHAISINVDDEESVKDAASEATWGMMTYYHGNETGAIPGAFPEYWWEGSILFLALLNYWHYTKDDTYNDELSIGLQWQGGDNGDYLPGNYSQYLGNDDQMFWGIAAITAAEYGFPDRPSGYSWLALAQGVFNSQKTPPEGWDPTTCGGGLRWQRTPLQGDGYLLKNSVSNGGFFQLAARLAAYTDNTEYSDWAIKTWKWAVKVNVINTKTWNVADSTNGQNECADIDHMQWTYNYGAWMTGAAYLYAHTKDKQWLEAVEGLLEALWRTFVFPQNQNVLSDFECEIRENCNRNNILFKGITSQWLATIALLIPDLEDKILPRIQTSAKGAAKSCSGKGSNVCGVRWYGGYDGKPGMESQISASTVFSSILIKFANKKKAKPLTSSTGGDSKSDPNAGTKDTGSSESDLPQYPPITTADKAGAGIMTAAMVSGVVGMGAFMFVGA